jgi:hypothetical protein
MSNVPARTFAEAGRAGFRRSALRLWDFLESPTPAYRMILLGEVEADDYRTEEALSSLPLLQTFTVTSKLTTSKTEY